MPEGCEFDKKETPWCGTLYSITKCPNFTEDTGGSDAKVDMCIPLIETLKMVNERDYVSCFEIVEREFRKPKKIIVIDDYGDFKIKRKCLDLCSFQKLVDIEQFYRSGFFGLLSDEDAQLMIGKLRRKARERIKHRKNGVKK